MPNSSTTVVTLRTGRDKPVRQRHPWIFSGAIQNIPADIEDGAIVDIADAQGRRMARGYLNRASQIQVRILTWEKDEEVDRAFWRKRLHAAGELRERWKLAGDSNAYRLVNGESDYLPGLVVDRYADYLVMQVGTLGIDRRKQELAELLLELTGCRGVIERSELAARRQEGLEDAGGLLAGEAPTEHVEVHESGLRFNVDLLHGQKTGFYTDQRENRARVAAYCAGANVLNAFSYTGAFAVHALAAGARQVANVEASYEALALAEANLRLNDFDPDTQTQNVAGDVFAVLRNWRDIDASGELFDIVILDPPKFVQAREHMDRGLRGYKEINMLALRLLKPGGILVTFSCSGLVSADLFQKVIFGAAVDAGRDLQILERLQHARDHTVAITFPQGDYLKGLICYAP